MENTDKAKKRDKRKKFRLTRQLVKLALNDGWTQKAIAEKCRTQQSIVSAWARGEKQGTESQLTPLLEIYGNKLRRKTFQVYYSFDKEAGYKFYKVEGKIIFSCTLVEIESETRGNRLITKKIPVEKIIVHEQGKDTFRIIFQNRPRSINGFYLECLHEKGNFFSQISDEKNSNEIIDEIEKIAANIKESGNKEFFDQAFALPFLIRKAFIENGYPVKGVENFPAMW